MQDAETAEVYVLHRSEHKKIGGGHIVVFRHLHFQVHCIERSCNTTYLKSLFVHLASIAVDDF